MTNSLENDIKIASTSSLTETSSNMAIDVKSDDVQLKFMGQSDTTQLNLFRLDSTSVKKKSKFVAVWSEEEDSQLLNLVQKYGDSAWNRISKSLVGKSEIKCNMRWLELTNQSHFVSQGTWTENEDTILAEKVCIFGARNWTQIAKFLPGRIGKQCRERWHNHLSPNVNKTKWTKDEDNKILELHSRMGNRWCDIAKYLPGRTDNAIKNRFNSRLSRLIRCRQISYPKVDATQDKSYSDVSVENFQQTIVQQPPSTNYVIPPQENRSLLVGYKRRYSESHISASTAPSQNVVLKRPCLQSRDWNSYLGISSQQTLLSQQQNLTTMQRLTTDKDYLLGRLIPSLAKNKVMAYCVPLFVAHANLKKMQENVPVQESGHRRTERLLQTQADKEN